MSVPRCRTTTNPAPSTTKSSSITRHWRTIQRILRALGASVSDVRQRLPAAHRRRPHSTARIANRLDAHASGDCAIAVPKRRRAQSETSQQGVSQPPGRLSHRPHESDRFPHQAQKLDRRFCFSFTDAQPCRRCADAVHGRAKRSGRSQGRTAPAATPCASPRHGASSSSHSRSCAEGCSARRSL